MVVKLSGVNCYEGRRSVPIELLDVAGLVPGAHQGRGLGNKFLDDLRLRNWAGTDLRHCIAGMGIRSGGIRWLAEGQWL
jgi:hypothetical protein